MKIKNRIAYFCVEPYLMSSESNYPLEQAAKCFLHEIEDLRETQKRSHLWQNFLSIFLYFGKQSFSLSYANLPVARSFFLPFLIQFPSASDVLKPNKYIHVFQFESQFLHCFVCFVLLRIHVA